MFVILFSVSAVAGNDDDFVLRSGIKFGDTIDTIVQKEKTLTRNSETSNTFTGKIAGYSDSECSFVFDDDGKLESMTYSFDCLSKDFTNSTYENLYDGLVRKYGKPKGNTLGNCELITGPALNRMSLWVYFFGELDGWSANYYDYDEWIVDCLNYHVKVDLVSYYYRNSDYKYTYTVELSYLKYTDEEYQKEIDKKQEMFDEVDTDL